MNLPLLHGQVWQRVVRHICDGEQKAQAIWERQHPLPQGRFGKHVIAPVGGRFHPAACALTGAESPALAAEGDLMFTAAAVALAAQEAVLRVSKKKPRFRRGFSNSLKRNC